MSGIQTDTIGIMPAGALGVAFYYHFSGGNLLEDNGVFFLDRPAGEASMEVHEADNLRICFGDRHFSIPTKDRFRGGMIECYDAGRLPELIIVATNPDQIDSVLQGIRLLLEWMRDEKAFDSKPLSFPYFLFVTNGIYFNRIRYRYVELLERAYMEGSLPDLWPDIAPQLVCRMLRGPTMILGQRTGSGADAVYRPGYKGNTVIGGGDTACRQRVQTLLAGRGLSVEISAQSPVSIELQKALVNLILNLFGVIYSIENDIGFRPLTIGDILAPEHHPEFIELGEHVYSIARAARAVPHHAGFADVWPKMLRLFQDFRTHYPSTMQSIAQSVTGRGVIPEMTPNEAWLLEPLKELAANLEERKALAYLLKLEERYRDTLKFLSKLALSARHE